MKLKHFSKYICTSFLVASPLLALDCSSTRDILEYNGHYYTITTDKLSFDVAKQVAENNGGYLAIPNTTTENGFIKGLIGGSTAWIGVWDPNYTSSYCLEGSGVCPTDPSRFKTVKNETLTYSNWEVAQPDNFVREYDIVDGKAMVAPLGEHWGVMSGNSGRWADYGLHADSFNNPAKFIAVFEYDTKPECFKEDDALAADDFEEKKCNTSVWDETADVLTPGQTFSCLTDQYGTDYCPEALAPADTYWDYNDGYSVANTGSVVDYVDKIIIEGPITTTTFKSSGTFVVPTGVSSVELCMVGGGGGGARGNVGIEGPYYFFGGGYAGEVVSKNIVVTPGQQINVVVGAGGNNGYSGGRTSFGSIVAKGGAGGTSSYSIHVTYEGSGAARTTCGGTGYDGARALSSHGGQSSGFSNGGKAIYSNNERPVTYTTGVGSGGGGSASDWVADYTPGGKGEVRVKYKSYINKCPDGYTEHDSDTCKKTVSYTYYNYLCSEGTAQSTGGDVPKTDPNTSADNTATLDDPINSSTPPDNNCKSLKYTCNSEVRTPVWVDNQWQCSPFPCIGESDVENLDASVGASDPDNGGWNENGGCDGQIYLFSGKGEKCRSWDMFFGLAGGGCCDKDKVFAGLVECKANEKLLAEKNRAEQCHYVGEFCSKKIKLGFIKICVQKSKGHCCFNSKLGRILQEQGRPQLDMGWGSGENPQCRGFTPEEFQKLDMSRIDFSEFLEDFEAVDMSNLGTSIANRVNNNLNAAFPQPQ